ncbi:putative membrane protein [Spirosoma lacussanchae]|uniref:Small multi-drug export protein n=1 Tax=Spirosoma sordidisoli TaxID=2502893 RepID=A0A4Q2UJE5_9BACT|nr:MULTISPECIES: hypothetical protein [Spirosoma]RYC67701.1 hypothetical protein EQG79_23650 [Spirosoma sordidisoli]
MQFAKYLSVAIASTIKFAGGPLTGLALGLSWIETALCTIVGMMLSVIAITYAGAAIQLLSQRIRKQTPKRFTRRTRLAVRIYKRSGLLGIAFLTPLILTPIGGTALAVSFRLGRGQILLYMLGSAVLWACVQTLALYQIPGAQEFFKR